ncbi:hypothetical protein OIO90_003140 [Microbotryomycetes sp. JL221]|nr:hypothetical protein OIO90_003140 [Microbotryomycetes sp. JL221]
MIPGKRLADIAAPAVPQEPEQPQQKKESAKQKARIEQGLDETRVDSVRVDGLALMKIIKHSRESHVVVPAPAGTSNATATFSPAVGQLLGIDSHGVLDVSNVFALPAGSLGGATSDDHSEQRGSKAAQKYTSQYLPRMSDLNADASLVGFYTSTNNGQQLAIGGFVDALVGAQLTGGGVGSLSKAAPVGRSGAASKTSSLPAGTGHKNGKGIALVYDIASAAQGSVGLRAFRLAPNFVETYRAGKFDTASLIENGVVPSNILEEVPVTVRSSPLLTAFLSTLVTPTSNTSSSSTSSLARTSQLDPHASFAALSLPTSSLPAALPSPLTAPINALLTSLDTHSQHLSTLSFQSRQLARDKARVESLPAVQRRRQENEQRQKDGLSLLPLLPEEQALQQEPSRFDTLLALGAVEGAANGLSEATGTSLVRSFGSRAGMTTV